MAGYPYKALGYVAAGPLRSTVMGSYAADGDHPKRMVSVEANSKFANPQTGPDEPWQVQAAPCQRRLPVQRWQAFAAAFFAPGPQCRALPSCAQDPPAQLAPVRLSNSCGLAVLQDQAHSWAEPGAEVLE